MAESKPAWPPLPLEAWRDTYATLHMITQVVGKIRLACGPMVNHWWGTTLYVTPRGLTTSLMPHGTRVFQIDLDLLDGELRVLTGEGNVRALGLAGRSVASFYRETIAALDGLGLPVRIWTRPQEVEDAIPFERDESHRTFDAAHARAFLHVLLQADRMMRAFRGAFLGKSSPVHFFWGGFDLAVTRFSGRRAPEHPGGVPNMADWVVREAYSHEVSSAGFWPGSDALPEPAFYSYAYPEPEGYATWPLTVPGAYYQPELREWILPWDAVRTAGDPDSLLESFLLQTYIAAAELGGWDRVALERSNP